MKSLKVFFNKFVSSTVQPKIMKIDVKNVYVFTAVISDISNTGQYKKQLLYMNGYIKIEIPRFVEPFFFAVTTCSTATFSSFSKTKTRKIQCLKSYILFVVCWVQYAY